MDTRSAAEQSSPFSCGNGVPVNPAVSIDDDPPADILIVPELWLSPDAKDVVLLAVPETAGSALYGMVDVLSAAGTIWQTLFRTEGATQLFNPRIAGTAKGSCHTPNSFGTRRTGTGSWVMPSGGWRRTSPNSTPSGG